MSCNTKTSLAAVIDAVNAQLNNNYVDRDDPRIDQGVFTEPTIRGGLMLDEAAKLDFCGYVTECGQREPFGKQWVDRPLYPHNTLVSYEDGGEIKSRWQDTDDVVAGTEIGESYTTYEETRSLGLQGYTIIDSFELGETITQRNQALRHAATGKLYRWAGDLPKIVPADSTPVSSGGVDTNAWLEVSDTALRQEILTGGLLTVNKGLESIADLSTIQNPKDGLRVYVKSYHAGLNKGGGYFTYVSSRASENDGGTVINGWVREESAYIDMNYFGGDEYVGEPMAAIQAAIDFVHPTGTVSIKGWAGTKIFDGSIIINKPLTFFGNKDEVKLKLADNSNLFNNTKNLRTANIVSITSSNVIFKETHIDPNKLNNYVIHEGIRYYFLETPSEVAPDLPSTEQKLLFRYLGTVSVKADTSITDSNDNIKNVVIEGNNFTNCSVHAVIVNGGIPMTEFANTPPDTNNVDKYARNIRINNNFISGGCRSGIAFISGVINSKIEGNTAYNWNWTAHRFYFGVANCEMRNNNTVVDLDSARPDEFESSSPNFTSSGFVGYKIGHSTRGTGSCTDSLVIGNSYLDFGGQQGSGVSAKAFIQAAYIVNTSLIRNNFVSTATAYDYALDVTPLSVIDIMSFVDIQGISESIKIQGNTFKADRLYSLLLKPVNGEEDNKHKIDIQGNSFLRNNDRSTASTAIYLGTFSSTYTESRLPIISIHNNIADRYAYFIYSQSILQNTTYISNNNILNVYNPESSLNIGVLYPMLGRTIIEGNFISTSSAYSESLFRAIQTNILARGAIKDNTIQTPKTTRVSVIAASSNMTSFNNYRVDFEGGFLKLEERVGGTEIIPPATSGTSEKRPVGVPVGYAYFDTTLGLPIYFKSTGIWVDSTGVTV